MRGDAMPSYTALAAISVTAGSASARELAALQGESIVVRAFHGMVYYTKEDRGFRVLTAMAAGDGELPYWWCVTTVTEGQQISIPGESGEFSRVLEISCVDGKLFLTKGEATTVTALIN
jgi:hypothetical protein